MTPTSAEKERAHNGKKVGVLFSSPGLGNSDESPQLQGRFRRSQSSGVLADDHIRISRRFDIPGFRVGKVSIVF